MSVDNFVCGPLPLVAALGVFAPPGGSAKKYYIPQDPKAWPSHSSFSYSFVGGAPSFSKQELVKDAITKYTRYANVNLAPAPEGQEVSASIRISFDGTRGAWSAIGTDALQIKSGATMNLGFLSAEPSNDEERKKFYDLTLHQFGHAFGLAHEWNRAWATLIDEEDYEAVKQHKTAFPHNNTSNFSKPDTDSIMKFFVPEKFSNIGTAVKLTGGLSKKDKAWLTLIYPGKAGGDEETGILKSLNDLEVPLEEASRILLCATVSEMRFQYHEYISKTYEDRLGAQAVQAAIIALKDEKGLLKPVSHVLEGKVTGITPLVDHNNEDDLYDTVAAAVLNPQFHQVLANVVNQDGDGQRGPILPSAPSTPDVQHFIGPLISVLGPLLGQLLVSQLPSGAASGIYPQALPPNVEQGIFNVFTTFLKHPTFLKIVQGVTTDMITQHEKSKST